jgi:hypothetical protein
MIDFGRGRAMWFWFNIAMAQRAAAPPVVTVLAILLYIGGGLVAVYALIGLGGSVGAVTGLMPVWGQALYGALYIGLARALQLGWRWAWVVARALCWVGLAVAVLYLFARGSQAAVEQGVWPATYLLLLTRPSVREWFASNLAPPDEGTTGG